jgi:hypothetical protein
LPRWCIPKDQLTKGGENVTQMEIIYCSLLRISYTFIMGITVLLHENLRLNKKKAQNPTFVENQQKLGPFITNIIKNFISEYCREFGP